MTDLHGHGARAPASVGSPDAAGALCEKIRADLERRRDALCREIGDYPPPRPACDVDFNTLLEERALVFQALARLDALLDADLAPDQLVAALSELSSASPAFNQAAKTAQGQDR